MNSLALVWVLIVQPGPHGDLTAVDKYPSQAKCEAVMEQTKRNDPTKWVYAKCLQLPENTKTRH